jgi:hypothetical protein
MVMCFWVSAVNEDANCLVCIAPVIDEWMSKEHWWNDTDREKLKHSEENLSSATLSTTNLTQTVIGSNLDLHSEWAACPGQFSICKR